MCTVTVVRPSLRSAVRTLPLLRLVCNRDENRSRAPAIPPTIRTLENRAALMPIDPASGGTWIAVNDAGLVACLLNRTIPSPSLPAGTRSRGEIVPALLATQSLDAAIASALRINVANYPMFRVLLADNDRTVVLASDGDRLAVQTDAPGPVSIMATSSGLGDHLVEDARRALFRESFANTTNDRDDPIATQDRFHEHRWAGREHLSVLMSRAHARTVSRIVIDITDAAATMTYTPLDESGTPTSTPARAVLSLAPRGANR